MRVARMDSEGEVIVVKCVVWDLDDTMWDGVLLEDPDVRLRPEVRAVVEELDRRGIVQSVASRNDPDTALRKLEALGLLEFFLYPQIGWGAKSGSVERVAKGLNLGIDTFAFIDDQPFEREEVATAHPRILTVEPSEVQSMLDWPEFNPRFVTDASARRRSMYQDEKVRKTEEDGFEGPPEEFLRGLKMRFRVYPAEEEALRRAEELTVRTNQLNTTGKTYSYETLDTLRQSSSHHLLMAELEDRLGSYGRVGLALVEVNSDHWMLDLLLMSCRVMSRGVGQIMLSHILECAQKQGVPLRARFKSNGRNRSMLVTYRFSGFRVIEQDCDEMVLEHSGTAVPAMPDYVDCDLADIATPIVV